MALNTYVVSLILFIVAVSDAAKILAVFPTPSISHQIVFRSLTQELAKLGHEVTVITTDPAFPKEKALPNLKEIDMHNISYSMWEKYLLVSTNTDEDDEITKMTIGAETMIRVFEEQFLSKEVQEIINDKCRKFDLLIAEATINLALVFSHIYKVPVIQISSFGSVGHYETVGAPSHPILYPSLFRKKLYNLTLMEKVAELWNHYKLLNLFNDLGHLKGDEMLRRIVGPGVPNIKELEKNVDIVFLNMHPIWEGNRPVPPNLIYLGGLHQKILKEIPKDLKEYLDSSSNGVIYISFGTNVRPSLIPPEKIQIFIKIFSQLHYNVLWKWDQDDLPGISDNIQISQWFPQSDMLVHPNIKLFITQGGLQSTDEAITAEVPLIGIPMLGDQWYNVEKYVYHKIGVRLDLETLTGDKLSKAIDTVLGDDSYRQNIKRLHQIMIDQPQTPLQRAVWWTEYVLRHGNTKNLRSSSADVSWAEYLEVELVLVIATLILVYLAMVFIVVRRLVSMTLRFIFMLQRKNVRAKVSMLRKIKSKRKNRNKF